MKPYGTYGRHILDYRLFNSCDVQEAQDCLAQGYRIRNKKQKRRLHNKKTRQAAKQETRKLY